MNKNNLDYINENWEYRSIDKTKYEAYLKVKNKAKEIHKRLSNQFITEDMLKTFDDDLEDWSESLIMGYVPDRTTTKNSKDVWYY